MENSEPQYGFDAGYDTYRNSLTKIFYETFV